MKMIAPLRAPATFMMAAVMMMFGALTLNEFTKPLLLVSLAAMAASILASDMPRKPKYGVFFAYMYKAYCQTFVVPFLVLFGSIEVASSLSISVSDTDGAFFRFGLAIWSCLMVFVFPLIGVRFPLEEWIENNRGKHFLKHLQIDSWIRVAIDAFWVTFLVVCLQLFT